MTYTVLDCRPDGTFLVLADHVSLAEAKEAAKHGHWAVKIIQD